MEHGDTVVIEMAPGLLSGIGPIMAIALVGALGVGSQWIAWRLRMPAIVFMLAAGLIVGPITGLFDPARDLGSLTTSIIAIAVAVILFEGGLTLNFAGLRDAATGVRRLVIIGAPLGWFLSTLAAHYGAGLSWESSAVFGGILIVTGPTVIAPLLRQARLTSRPAKLLQWEAIVNDPIGALAGVLAFEVVLVLRASTTAGEAVQELAIGIAIAIGLGLAAGFGLARAFKKGWVPEYMKVSVLFASLLLVFALADKVLHESGLLAVTIMGIVIANSNLPSLVELRRFKEHATVLLVSGVFILLAASLDLAMMAQLTWRAVLLVLLIVLIARPLTVFGALATTRLPIKEQALVAFTGPRGVVLVAVAGFFGERLVQVGVADGALIAPLAFVLVMATVVLHGFTLGRVARRLGLSGGETTGVILVGASPFSIALAETLQRAEVPVLITDPERWRLRQVRDANLPSFYGDILSEAAEHSVELVNFETVIAATDNDAYNTLVATNLGPEYGRDNVFQVARYAPAGKRHELPPTLGGRAFMDGASLADLNGRVQDGWRFSATPLTKEYGIEDWRDKRPNAIVAAELVADELRLVGPDVEIDAKAGTVLIAMLPPGDASEAKSRPAAPEEEMADTG